MKTLAVLGVITTSSTHLWNSTAQAQELRTSGRILPAYPYLKELERKAQQAAEQGRTKDAIALYRKLISLSNISVQNEIGPYEQLARCHAALGDIDEAVSVLETAMQVPPAPQAKAPSPLGRPFDLRGELRWKIAEYRRRQGHWKEALQLYELNQRLYPRNDGGAPSGFAFLQVAMVEGQCLENLGHYHWASHLYWLAAVRLDPSIPPVALRRLIDLAVAANQTELLEKQLRIRLEEDKKRDESVYGASPLSHYRTILAFRKAASKHDWQPLIDALVAPPPHGANNEEQFSRDAAEAIAALKTKGTAAAVPLEAALRSHPDNGRLRVAVAVCGIQVPEQIPIRLISNPSSSLADHYRYRPWAEDLFSSESLPALPADLKLSFDQLGDLPQSWH